MRIGLVLPDVMGTYGDGGNSVVLRQRLRLRGIDAEVVEITLADPVPAELDLYTLGGAEDYAQRLATRHLIRYPGLQQAAARGAPVLAICAAIQVLGHWYETSSGERVDGVGMLDVTTSPQDKRTIGEVVSQPLLTELSDRLTGFENHRGGTVLGSSARPLAKVISGAGNRAGRRHRRCGAGQRCRRRICTGRAWRAIRSLRTTYFRAWSATWPRWRSTRSRCYARSVWRPPAASEHQRYAAKVRVNPCNSLISMKQPRLTRAASTRAITSCGLSSAITRMTIQPSASSMRSLAMSFTY